MSQTQKKADNALTVRDDQMLFAIPIEEAGVEETLYTTQGGHENGHRRIKLAGAWSDLDWQEAEAFFDRIDTEGIPSEALIDEDVL